MKSVIPYLQFKGECADAFSLYRSIFGGEFYFEKRRNELLSYDAESIAGGQAREVTYIILASDKITIMGSDDMTHYGLKKRGTGNVCLAVKTESKSESDKIFSQLAEGGNIIIPMQEISSKEYYGLLVDRFGIEWAVSFDLPD